MGIAADLLCLAPGRDLSELPPLRKAQCCMHIHSLTLTCTRTAMSLARRLPTRSTMVKTSITATASTRTPLGTPHLPSRSGCREKTRPSQLNQAEAVQGTESSCRDQEGIRGSEEALPGPSVFPSGHPGLSGDFWGSQEGCKGPFRPSGGNMLSRFCCV